MARLEDEIEKLRAELDALAARQYVPAATPEQLALYEEVGDLLMRGEDVPEELLEDLFADDPEEGATMRDFFPVAAEMIEEGYFDSGVDEDDEDHEIVGDR